MNTTQPEAVEAGEMSQGADEDDVEGEADGKEEDVDGQVEAGAEKAKRKRREAALLEREEGKSVFPFSRVQKIMKADRVSKFLSTNPRGIDGYFLHRIYLQ
jgi:hypothetical protein